MDLIVPAGQDPIRLDRFLAAHVAGASRRKLRALSDVLLVNGRPARRSAIVAAGDRITIPEAALAEPSVTPRPGLKLEILYADDAVIALDKPAGLSSTAVRGGDLDSAAAFLAARFPEMRDIGAPGDAGLVHRLDRETSGVLLAARTPLAHSRLRQQFRAGTIDKEYLAVVEGDLADSGWIRTPIAPDRRHPERSRLSPDDTGRADSRARPTATFYRPEVRYGTATLLHVAIHTGVRHQIRLHLASIAHAVVGDSLYGEDGRQTHHRQALHAHRLSFDHPTTGRRIQVESPLPDDLAELLRRLASAGPPHQRGSRRQAAQQRRHSRRL